MTTRPDPLLFGRMENGAAVDCGGGTGPLSL
jgi:hypothetical protein